MNPNESPELELDEILEEIPDFSLEEILKEFSEPEESEAAVSDAAEEPEQQPEKTVNMDATAVFTPPAEELREASPEEELPVPPPAESKEKPEPFSDEWEPEYEEPMGEFIPKAPIPFPPKNRLRQLRQKLVAGPERRYQALSEAGIGQLQIGIFVNFLLAALSVGITVVYTLGMIDASRLRTVIFGQLLLAMLAALVGCYRLLDGISKLFKGRFTLDAALSVTFLACIAEGLLCLSQQRLSCSSLFCLQMLMSQCAAYQRRNTELSQMDVLRKASDLTAIVKMDDFWQSRAGYTSAEGEPESFLEHYSKPSTPELVLSVYAVLSLLAAVGLAVAVYLLMDLHTAIQVFMAAQLIALPFSSFVAMSRPANIAQNRLHRLGAVLCGWQGVRVARRRGFYLLRHEDLFPEGTVKLNSVKFYGIVDPGRVVSYTTALLSHEKSGLMGVFRQLPRSRSSGAHTVENFTWIPGGIRGTVDGAEVVVGTSECMRVQGIVLTEEQQAEQAIYTAVDGTFSGAFALSYSRSKFSASGIRTLHADRHFKPVLVANDFTLTPKFIHGKLAVNIRRILFPDHDVRTTLSEKTPAEDAAVVALTTRSGLAPKACALTCARALRGALKAGAAIHMLGGILGLAAVGVLALNGGLALLTPVNLLLYSAIWAVPGLLITERTRF